MLTWCKIFTTLFTLNSLLCPARWTLKPIWSAGRISLKSFASLEKCFLRWLSNLNTEIFEELV
ncbi:hypothetical protein SAMN05444271_11765 [Halohasta litchfieldiae]|uniref:Uncharacterized protein n=1 Tax=Halohasta litchfieldiae TaxID=1073996 RepID=A0A1H6VM36_9EURY|nr:hypothetical protein SAMN05444271_11765 [Halohasta litchfieldiae]